MTGRGPGCALGRSLTRRGGRGPAQTNLADFRPRRDQTQGKGRLCFIAGVSISRAMTGVQPSNTEGIESRLLARLLHEIARGDRGALTRLYALTSARLFGLCMRVLRSEPDAEEVLQEVYVRVWTRAGQYDQARAGAMSWLATIARNGAIDRIRGRKPGGTPIDAANDVADEAPSAIELIERAEDSQRLGTCLDELDERPRAMIRAAFFEGLSYAELAERETVPLGTMKSMIRRGLIRLKGCLER